MVRDRKWGGRQTGTVTSREGRSVFVAWHGTCVDDELDVDEVEPVDDATDEQRAWRGGIGVIGSDGSVTVTDVHQLRP